MIDFEHVYKTYETHNDENVALEDINIHIDEGEFVFILGHSGAGKSTFLKLIQMEEKPTEGKVFINGQDLTRIKRRKVPYLRRQMGVVFQDFRLIPKMSVYDNVAFAMRVIGAKEREIRDRVPYVLELVGLENKARRLPREMNTDFSTLSSALILVPMLLASASDREESTYTMISLVWFSACTITSRL